MSSANRHFKLDVVLARLPGLVRQAYDTGFLHLLTTFAFVQGLAYVSQLAIARLTGPEDFGIVRIVETVLRLLVMVGAAGMPSLAVKAVAELGGTELTGVLLKRLLVIAVVCSLVVAVVMALNGSRFVPDEALAYFTATVWVIPLVVISRTCINYFQGIKQVQKMAAINAIASTASFLALIAFVVAFGLNGWVIGRYLGEILFVCASLFFIRGHLSRKGTLAFKYRYPILIKLGVGITLSLVTATALDSAGLLALGFMNRSAAEIGNFGLCTVIITGILLIPATLSNLALPRLVERVRVGTDVAWKYNVRVMQASLGITTLSAALLIVCSPLLVVVFGSAYAEATATLAILALGMPLRALGSQLGIWLLACDQASRSAILNTLGLALAAITFALMIPRFGITGAAWASVAIDAAVLLGYWLTSIFVRNRYAPVTHHEHTGN